MSLTKCIHARILALSLRTCIAEHSPVTTRRRLETSFITKHTLEIRKRFFLITSDYMWYGRHGKSIQYGRHLPTLHSLPTNPHFSHGTWPHSNLLKGDYTQPLPAFPLPPPLWLPPSPPSERHTDTNLSEFLSHLTQQASFIFSCA